jgi:hypothetical protein
MPITTPSNYIAVYNDKDHFIHILEFLFFPLLEKLGYTVIKPIAEGSEVIHSKIIRNLFDADLVFCDISILNPNVFFELGIRTALNKPVCIVKDNKIENIPFDTNDINIITYDAEIAPWNKEKNEKEIENHINATVELGKSNALWSVFGFDFSSNVEIDTSDSKEIEILKLQNRILKEKVDKNEKKEYSSNATVYQGKLVKCENCGFGFTINDNVFSFGITAATVKSITSAMYQAQTNINERNVVTCPKCGNVMAI